VTTARRLLADNDGERLDRFLAQREPELSRSFIQKLIVDGHITVNGRAAKSSLKLNTGDSINLVLPPPEPSPLTAEDIPLHIIYEDNDLLVVDKPAGMTTHPAPGSRAHTLVNALLAHLPKLPESDNPARPGIVHRLDKDTSGLIVVAKTPQALNNLAAQFKSRRVKKTYVALVQGRMAPAKGVIEAPIGRDAIHRQRMAVTFTGREARTLYQVIKFIGNYTLLELKPETGRTHQIRVHLAATGHPVVGDTTYGIKTDLAPRQFLHAYRISFELPTSRKPVEFSSPLPPDLLAVLEKLKSQG
jgi:23S rRNA pseudouridine1911/1915/1917 synthase